MNLIPAELKCDECGWNAIHYGKFTEAALIHMLHRAQCKPKNATTITFNMSGGVLESVAYDIPAEQKPDIPPTLLEEADYRHYRSSGEEFVRNIMAYNKEHENDADNDVGARLLPEERQILAMRLWHPDQHAGYTLSELAFVFAQPRERVREIQDDALRKLAMIPLQED